MNSKTNGGLIKVLLRGDTGRATMVSEATKSTCYNKGLESGSSAVDKTVLRRQKLYDFIDEVNYAEGEELAWLFFSRCLLLKIVRGWSSIVQHGKAREGILKQRHDLLAQVLRARSLQTLWGVWCNALRLKEEARASLVADLSKKQHLGILRKMVDQWKNRLDFVQNVLEPQAACLYRQKSLFRRHKLLYDFFTKWQKTCLAKQKLHTRLEREFTRLNRIKAHNNYLLKVLLLQWKRKKFYVGVLLPSICEKHLCFRGAAIVRWRWAQWCRALCFVRMELVEGNMLRGALKRKEKSLFLDYFTKWKNTLAFYRNRREQRLAKLDALEQTISDARIAKVKRYALLIWNRKLRIRVGRMKAMRLDVHTEMLDVVLKQCVARRNYFKNLKLKVMRALKCYTFYQKRAGERERASLCYEDAFSKGYLDGNGSYIADSETEDKENATTQYYAAVQNRRKHIDEKRKTSATATHTQKFCTREDSFSKSIVTGQKSSTKNQGRDLQDPDMRLSYVELYKRRQVYLKMGELI
eukprot:Nk52_evm25s2085 gene=Nk52_evmTU25s2085